MFWKRLGIFIKTWAVILEIHQVFLWKINGSTELPYTNIPYACFVGAFIKDVSYFFRILDTPYIGNFLTVFDPFPLVLPPSPLNCRRLLWMDPYICVKTIRRRITYTIGGTQNACLTLYTKSVQDNGNQKQHYTFLRALCCLFALYSYRFKRTLAHPRKILKTGSD
jgi:hypothetical protein